MVVIRDSRIQKTMGHGERKYMVVRTGSNLSFRSLLYIGLEQMLKSIERGFPIPFLQCLLYI